MTSKYHPTLVYSFLVLMLGTSLGATAADPHPEVSKFVMDSIVKRLEIEVTQMRHASLKTVMTCDIFEAKPWQVNPDGSKESSSNYRVYKNRDKMGLLGNNGTDEVSAEIMSCIKSDFVVADEKGAMALMDALELVTSGGSSPDERSVSKSDNGWMLVTGKFFDDLKGYMVTSDKKGKISSIKSSYDLNSL